MPYSSVVKLVRRYFWNLARRAKDELGRQALFARRINLTRAGRIAPAEHTAALGVRGMRSAQLHYRLRFNAPGDSRPKKPRKFHHVGEVHLHAALGPTEPLLGNLPALAIN